MPARVPIVGGNWKCNGTIASGKELVEALKAGDWAKEKVEVVVCPVSVQIPMVQAELGKKPIKVGVQNISATGCGAFTGEIAANQVTDFGLEWAIIGHSERRVKYGEKDDVLAQKVALAQAEKLNVIFCIGETLEERDANQTDAVCERQLAAVFPVIKDWSKIVIAYEPVWAIGTGKVATPEQAQAAHQNIRAFIAKQVSALVADHVRIQYGGSVTPDNCKELMALPDIDGFLVGGASLKPGFVTIIQAAADACEGVVTPQKLPSVGGGCAGPLTVIVLDGYGIAPEGDGNCISLAKPENLAKYESDAKAAGVFASLAAHGTAVGLPEDADMGNSEVGHNALGCGQWVAQGSRLVNGYVLDGALYGTENWKGIVSQAKSGADKAVHLFALLSDGGVHSNIAHLFMIIDNLARDGVKKVRIHALTDGRDVGMHTSEKFVPMLENKLAEAAGISGGGDYQVASGGGRMYCTMDRYEADWNIVKRGWDAMVHGSIDGSIVSELNTNGYTGMYKSMSHFREEVRKCFPDKSDQNYPPFVIVDESGSPVGKVNDGDIFVCTNFRGDRALQISRAFVQEDLQGFDRGRVPKCEYYGMLIYDNDLGIPKKSLCPNPSINNVLSEFMLKNDISMYAISETQKFGHMTFFWNGNCSGYLDKSKEKYVEIPSDSVTPEHIMSAPAMKCVEIADELVGAIKENKYKFYRVNFANPDMCGHTGLVEETSQSIHMMDAEVKKVVDATLEKDGIVLVTADHGNAETMKDKKGVTMASHTTNPVPMFLIGNSGLTFDTTGVARPALTNVAATICTVLGLEAPAIWDRTLAKKAGA
jgi:2,3-bisphosphoglycerate-independent phosphoglycerate mutase